MVADQEWHEYIDSLSLSDVTSNELSSGLPPTTLRTGGSISVGSKKISSTDTIGKSTYHFSLFCYCSLGKEICMQKVSDFLNLVA